MTSENAERPTPNAQSRIQSLPIALTIAGSDSSAGAGIQADLKTFTALGVYGLTAVTCIVAETPGKVSRIEAASPEIVREQIDVLVKGFPIAAMKTGLLCSAAIVSAVAKAVVDLGTGRVRPTGGLAREIPLVVDPVMIATSGAQLLEPNAVDAYEKELFPRATLITPNLDEAAKLLGEKIKNQESMEHAARALSEKYRTNILLKGGHLAGNEAVDLLFANNRITRFSAAFVRNVPTHGTGCTYSAAITAGLAHGLSLEKSIQRAKDFVTAAIQNHFRWGEIYSLNPSASRGNE